jgi:hypothetical protein
MISKNGLKFSFMAIRFWYYTDIIHELQLRVGWNTSYDEWHDVKKSPRLQVK